MKHLISAVIILMLTVFSAFSQMKNDSITGKGMQTLEKFQVHQNEDDSNQIGDNFKVNKHKNSEKSQSLLSKLSQNYFPLQIGNSWFYKYENACPLFS